MIHRHSCKVLEIEFGSIYSNRVNGGLADLDLDCPAQLPPRPLTVYEQFDASSNPPEVQQLDLPGATVMI